MSEAIKLIVDGYLTLKDRAALEDIRAHRQRLRKQLEGGPKSYVSVAPVTQLLDEELSVIEAALARF